MTLRNVFSPREKSRAVRGPSDSSIVLIMIVMMMLVFAPVLGVHAYAAFAPGAVGATAPSGTGVANTAPSPRRSPG